MADNFKFLQAQSFSLAGSGAIIGDTTLVLKSLKDIDGNLVTMSSFGTIGFGTLEPGNGSLEEQICWTGVTQNANGTATLTGVSSVSFAYPYTRTSGLLKTHAGATIFIVSNTSGFYDELTSKTDDETIAGTWTFTNPNYPQMDATTPLPTLDAQLTTKKYVDGVAVAGASNANTATKGIVQIATQAQRDAKTIIGSTSAYLVGDPSTQRSTLLSDYVIDTSTSANVIVITPSPAISAYTAGQQFSFKLANTNTSPVVTINVNGLGAKNLSTLNGTTSPSVGDLVSGGMIAVEYDGANFQVQSPTTQLQPTGSILMFGGSTAPSNYLLCDGTSYLQATYPNLFAVLGTSYGSADGTHFNVPDLRGRVPVGAGTGTGGGASGTGIPTGGSALTAVSRGTWKGEEAHVQALGELAAHTHAVAYENVGNTASGSNPAAGTTAASAGSVNTTSVGSSTAMNVIQPVMGLNFIIHI